MTLLANDCNYVGSVWRNTTFKRLHTRIILVTDVRILTAPRERRFICQILFDSDIKLTKSNTIYNEYELFYSFEQLI